MNEEYKSDNFKAVQCDVVGQNVIQVVELPEWE